MKKALVALCLTGLASSAMAQELFTKEGRAIRYFKTNNGGNPETSIFAERRTSNLINHGGQVIVHAKVVCIFWGPSWKTTDATLASSIQNFVANFGTSPQYKTITQYNGSNGTVALSSLGTTAWFDTSTPPTNVTDSVVQGEVSKYLGSSVGDPSTVYEVFIPSGSYSSSGSSTSCGGPNLRYCAYHSNYSHSGTDIKYSIQPYPSCSGCQNLGWSIAQDEQMFIGHETREAVTDPDGTTWWDNSGAEADDKCAWRNLFTDSNGFGYQPEWSNLVSGCVASTP